MANKYLFANILFSISKEGNRLMPPSYATMIVAIDACNASLEAILATYDIKGDVKRSTFQKGNDYLFSNLLLFKCEKGYGTTPPRFATTNAAMSASSVAREPLISSLLPTGGNVKAATLPMASILLIDATLFFASTDGQRETSSSCALIGAYKALL